MHFRLAPAIAFGLIVAAPAPAQAPPAIAAPSSRSLAGDLDLRPPRFLPESGRPVWPKDAAEAGERGVVEISLDIEEDGTVWRAMVMESSGFPRLDEAALTWAKTLKLDPPQRKVAGSDWAPTAWRDFRLTCDWRVGEPPHVRLGRRLG